MDENEEGEKSKKILRNYVYDTNLRDEFRRGALDELVKRDHIDTLDEIARDSNLRDEFRKTAFEGIKKSKK